MNYEVTKNTVDVSDGGFEEHPESYHPRVFVIAEEPDCSCCAEIKTFELLTNGWAIPWPRLPNKNCGFDFWYAYTDCMPTMVRNNKPNRAIPDANPSAPQADGDSTPLDHLPEGSH